MFNDRVKGFKMLGLGKQEKLRTSHIQDFYY